MQTTNPPNHQESINVMIQLDLWRTVKFLTLSVMSYYSDTKQVRNSYEYSRRAESPRYCAEFTMRYNNIFRNTLKKLKNRSRIVKNTPNSAQIGKELTQTRDDSRDFLSRSYKKGSSLLGGNQLQNECSS